jgi:IS5 family transposase
VEEGKDKIIYADAGYVGKEVQMGVKNRIHEKGKKKKKLTKKQERDNKAKSHIRVKVEHVFGMMTNTMKGDNGKRHRDSGGLFQHRAYEPGL